MGRRVCSFCCNVSCALIVPLPSMVACAPEPVYPKLANERAADVSMLALAQEVGHFSPCIVSGDAVAELHAMQEAFQFNVSRQMTGLRQPTGAAGKKTMRLQARRMRPMCGLIHMAAARCMKSRSQTNGKCKKLSARAHVRSCAREYAKYDMASLQVWEMLWWQMWVWQEDQMHQRK